MWIDFEDARSDFVLAAAVVLLSRIVFALALQLPLIPTSGVLAELLWFVLWPILVFVLTPLALTRYRRLGAASFGLADNQAAMAKGAVLAAVVVVHGVLRGLSAGSIPQAALGRFGVALDSSPVVGLTDVSGLPARIVVDVLVIVVFTLAGLVLWPFLTVRARDGFRQVDMGLTEALRTFGMGAAAVAGVIGLLNVVAGQISFVSLGLAVAALVALVLTTDALIPYGATTSRATVLAAPIVALAAHVLAFGLFSGAVLIGLYAGLVAGAVVLVMAVLVESRQGWAAAPMVVAMAFYPTCLSPFGWFLPGRVC